MLMTLNNETIGVIVAVVYIIVSMKNRADTKEFGIQTSKARFWIKNIIVIDAVLFIAYIFASYNGMQLMGVGTDVQQFVKGLVLIFAVLLEVMKKGNVIDGSDCFFVKLENLSILSGRDL